MSGCTAVTGGRATAPPDPLPFPVSGDSAVVNPKSRVGTVPLPPKYVSLATVSERAVEDAVAAWESWGFRVPVSVLVVRFPKDAPCQVRGTDSWACRDGKIVLDAGEVQPLYERSGSLSVLMLVAREVGREAVGMMGSGARLEADYRSRGECLAGAHLRWVVNGESELFTATAEQVRLTRERMPVSSESDAAFDIGYFGSPSDCLLS